MYTKNNVLENLRRKNEELEDIIKVITEKVAEWDGTYMRDRHAAPSILQELEKLLGIVDSKGGNANDARAQRDD